MGLSLDIVLVNWNSRDLLRECLASVQSVDRTEFQLRRVVVVDNASTDGSADGLEALDLPLVVVRNRENRGFAAACNQGAQGSEADFVLFLNPDTRLYPDSLRAPLRFMSRPEQQGVGICGIQLVDDHGQVSRSCARFPTTGMFLAQMVGLNRIFAGRGLDHAMLEWDHMETREVDQVIGAFFLVRRSLFESLGGFDERFFVYFEEVDFAYRARQAGWASLFLAEAQAYHLGGGTSSQVKALRLFYSLRSRLLFAYKHYNWRSATLLTLGTLGLEPLARIGLLLAKRSLKGVAETAQGYARLWPVALRLLVSAGRSA